MKRTIFGSLMLGALITGCAREPDTVLVIDDATVQSTDAQGHPWCSDGTSPAVSVSVSAGAQHASTPALQGSFVTWHAQTIEASSAQWAKGVELRARGTCAGRSFDIAAVRLHPSEQDLRIRGLAVINVGGLTSLHIHFLPRSVMRLDGGSDDGSGGFGYYYGYDSYYDYYDGSDVAPPPDGVYDDTESDCGCDVASDPSAGGGDTGGGDTGGDTAGGDTGGDSGGDTGGGDTGGGDSGGGDSGGDSRIGSHHTKRPVAFSKTRRHSLAHVIVNSAGGSVR